MPRKGPAPRRELMPDPIYRSVLVTQSSTRSCSAASAPPPSASSTTPSTIIEEKTGAEPIATLKRADRERQAPARGQEPPRRRRHLPGARRGPAPPGQHPRHPLDRRLLPPAPREDDGRAPRQRAARRQQRHRRLGEAPGRHAQDGRVQQGLRPLPLVATAPNRAGGMRPRACLATGRRTEPSPGRTPHRRRDST